ncbi:DUF3617 domain-containing protein [Alcaligenaceae bacterium]|nr:DUF3617 domain-containing protein [Alcaligenaceae bacterium]
MKTPYVQATAALFVALTATAHAQSVQPGLWEIQHDMRIPGQPDISAQMAQMREQMKGLPPEARKMMEQQMGSMGIGMGEGTALRICLAPEDIKDDVIREGDTEGDCTFTKVSRSGNTWRGHMVCTDPPSQGDFTTTLHGPAHYTTEATLTSPEHGRIDMKTDARRISGDCGTLAKTPR